MRSPCLTCPDRSRNKNKPPCVDCDARVAYAAYIEGSDHFLNTRGCAIDENNISDASIQNNPPDKEFIKTCPRCGKTGLAAELFSRHHSSKDGFTNICKDCWGAAIKAARGKTNEKQTMKKKEPVPAGERIVKAMKEERTMVLSLPESLREKLAAMAADQLRTPENMIAYLIYKAEWVS